MEEMKNMTSEASGPSGINPFVTKKFGKALGPYLTLYYNKMIDDEEVPEINRFNFVAPLLKPGKPSEDPASYRPVSLTETWFRLFERIVKKHVVRHLDEIGFISRYQHGFITGKSTFTNLLENQEKSSTSLNRGLQ